MTVYSNKITVTVNAEQLMLTLSADKTILPSTGGTVNFTATLYRQEGSQNVPVSGATITLMDLTTGSYTTQTTDSGGEAHFQVTFPANNTTNNITYTLQASYD